ncbi:hypothetical protein N431DRAFT_449178 [Stipitochalara longipes BDJ]|nr:hypothetical protein N431DRAFT_449178 [Stipitochalara longipes BDJ]
MPCFWSWKAKVNHKYEIIKTTTVAVIHETKPKGIDKATQTENFLSEPLKAYRPARSASLNTLVPENKGSSATVVGTSRSNSVKIPSGASTQVQQRLSALQDFEGKVKRALDRVGNLVSTVISKRSKRPSIPSIVVEVGEELEELPRAPFANQARGSSSLSLPESRGQWPKDTTLYTKRQGPGKKEVRQAVKQEAIREIKQEVKQMPHPLHGPPMNTKQTNLSTTDSKDLSNENENENEEKEAKKKVYKFEDELVTDVKSLRIANAQLPSVSCATSSSTSSNRNSGTSTIRAYSNSYDPLPDLNLPTETLIDKYLEENYREQAETFVRISSRSSIRSRSKDPRSGSCSSNSSAATCGTTFETPSRPPQSFAAVRRSQSLQSPPTHAKDVSRSSSSTSRILLEPYQNKLNPALRKHSSGGPPPQSPAICGRHVLTVPENGSPDAIESRSRSTSAAARDPIYFTKAERQAIADLVSASAPARYCRHENCTDCTNREFAYHENKAMATSLPPEERQKIINNNRSLRNIKNELESLAEHGAISDEVYDTIMRSLPAESPLNSSTRSNGAASSIPTNAFNNMRINNEPPPPAYNTPTPPSLPSRTPSQPASKPEIARAIALYRYDEPEDCTFEVGDNISVFEYMNADWWLGKNMRTGKEGVFPVNYVQVKQTPTPALAQDSFGNEKAGGYSSYPGQQAQALPPPGPSNPYDSSVPPMAVANQPAANGPPSKGQENAKKFGKKLGNAAVFGAGATLGGKIVNSIF